MKCDKFVVISESETASDLKPVDQKSLEASKQTNPKLQADQAEKEPTYPTIKSKCETEETINSDRTNSSISKSKTGNLLRFLLLFLIGMVKI